MESDQGVVPFDNNINKTFDPSKMSTTIDIYYLAASPPCRATLLLINALGIKHNIKVTNVMQGDTMKPEYLKMNPMHTIPTINDNGFILWDSSVIMKYLVSEYAKDDSMYPKDPKRAAIVDQRLYYVATMLFPRFIAYVMPTLMLNEQPDSEKFEKLHEAFGVLNKFLDNQIWAAGQYLTIADFSIISIVSTLDQCSISLSKYVNIIHWYQRTKNAMFAYGYEEINQAGSEAFGLMYKTKLQEHQ